MKRVYHVNDPNLPDDALYIGRGGAHGHKGSEWANPHKMGNEDERDWVIALYVKKRYRDAETAFALAHGIRVGIGNRPLACWCAPKHCHGDFLADVEDQRTLGDAVRRIYEWLRWADIILAGYQNVVYPMDDKGQDNG